MQQQYILGVDDEPINQIILEEFLGDDFEITCVKDGESCLASVKQRRPDLILLDVNMPGMSGLEVCRELRKAEGCGDIPIIFVSALSNPDERLAGYKAGGDDYITKPFVEQELMQKIRLLLQTQLEKNSLIKARKETMDALITSLNSSGELSTVIGFISSSFTHHSADDLAKAVFNALADYHLTGALLIHFQDTDQVYFSDGIESNLEREVLNQINDDERIVTFGRRVIFKGQHSALLIREMPHDDEKTGRLRDHLAILLDALDARLIGLDFETQAQNKHLILLNKLEDAQQNLLRIQTRNNSLRNRNAESLANMTHKIGDSFIRLGLTQEQQKVLLQLLAETERQTDLLYREGQEMGQEFTYILEELTESLKNG